VLIEIKVEEVKVATKPQARYVGILLRDGVEIYRSKPRPYRSCARALAAQERADREKRGEL